MLQNLPLTSGKKKRNPTKLPPYSVEATKLKNKA
jgi:hypothetical protein